MGGPGISGGHHHDNDDTIEAANPFHLGALSTGTVQPSGQGVRCVTYLTGLGEPRCMVHQVARVHLPRVLTTAALGFHSHAEVAPVTAKKMGLRTNVAVDDDGTLHNPQLATEAPVPRTQMTTHGKQRSAQGAKGGEGKVGGGGAEKGPRAGSRKKENPSAEKKPHVSWLAAWPVLQPGFFAQVQLPAAQPFRPPSPTSPLSLSLENTIRMVKVPGRGGAFEVLLWGC